MKNSWLKQSEKLEPHPVYSFNDPDFQNNIEEMVDKAMENNRILDLAKLKHPEIARGCSYCCQFRPKLPKSALARVIKYFDEEDVWFWEEYDSEGNLLLKEPREEGLH